MDKIQKIREEVERLQNELIQEKEKGFGSNTDDACILELQNVLTYIESLQEEPVSNPIDFEKELYKAFGQVKDFTLGMRIAKWFYDMGKNNQEHVSEKKCIFTKDSYTDEDRKVLCDDCEEECKYNKKEPSIPDIVDEHFDEMLGEESIPLNVQEAAHQYIFNTPSLILPLLHDTDLRWEKVVIEELERAFTAGIKWKESQISKDASKLT